ncbi:MAG: aldo/keto reductase [Clostridiales bacterium]|jgi:aryl-alcohol dehydrogenase-like predicted oxidoreductase|nr:aldo/keto reductase [Clostridiales bacterium]
MRYKRLGKSSLEVSVVGLGTWAIGGDFWGKVDDDRSIATIQRAIDCGINLIDTAPAYGIGHAERIVGKAVKGRRDKVIIATKCGIFKGGGRMVRDSSPESIRKEVDASLTRLGIDVIDLYQIHWPDYDTPLEDSLNEMAKLRDAGKIRYFGVSNFDKELMEKAVSIGGVVSLQPQYSLLQRGIEKDLLPFCRENGIGILAYGSLGGGILTGKFKERPKFEEGDNRENFYPFFREPLWSKAMELVEVLRQIAAEVDKPVAHVAINWLTQQDGVSTALVGAKTPEQAEQNAAAGEWELSQEQLDAIESAYKRIYG